MKLITPQCHPQLRKVSFMFFSLESGFRHGIVLLCFYMHMFNMLFYSIMIILSLYLFHGTRLLKKLIVYLVGCPTLEIWPIASSWLLVPIVPIFPISCWLDAGSDVAWNQSWVMTVSC